MIQLENGEWRPTYDAFFGGTERRISVDRAKWRNDDPAPMLVDDTDSICKLVAGQVRSIDVGAKKTTRGRIVHRYKVCVDATPKSYNDAHADIYAHPERATGKAYKLLREALAALAVWEEGFAPSDRKEE